MYEILKEEYGFKGSDRSVRLYVSKRKQELFEKVNQRITFRIETSNSSS